jgi:hypothetical protein
MTTVKSRTRARAEAKITVQSSEAKPIDQTARPALMEIRLSETFSGDINGEALGQACSKSPRAFLSRRLWTDRNGR